MRRNHRALFAALATLQAALAIGPAAAQSTTDGEIHVFLSGEDETQLAALPPPRDPSFPRPTWAGPAALPELIRSPLSPTGVVAPAGGGSDTMPKPVLPPLGATPDHRPATYQTAPNTTLPSGEPEPPADPVLPLPESSGLAPPAVWFPARAPEAALALPAGGSARAVVGLLYRTGHRLGLRGELGVRTRAVSAELVLVASAPDDVFPTPQGSPSALGVWARLDYTSPHIDLGIGAQAMGQAQVDGSQRALAHALADVVVRAGTLTTELGANAMAVTAENDPGVFMPRARVSLALGELGGLPLSAAVGGVAVVNLTGTAAGSADFTIAAGPWRRTRSAGLGVSVGTRDSAVTVWPVLSLSWGPPGLDLHARVGPRTAYADGLHRWTIQTTPVHGATLPERAVGLEVGLTLDREPVGWVDGDVSVWVGDLGWILDGRYGVERGGRASLEARGGFRLGSTTRLNLTIGSVVAWSDAVPLTLAGLRAGLSVAAGFWTGALLGILTDGPGWPLSLSAGPDQALDTAPGLQAAVRLEAGSKLVRGWTEARLLGGPVLTVEVGITLGAH